MSPNIDGIPKTKLHRLVNGWYSLSGDGSAIVDCVADIVLTLCLRGER